MAFAVPIAVGAVAAWLAPAGYGLLAYAIGSTLASYLMPKKGQTITQQPMTDLKVVGTDYGQPIPYVIAHPGIAGQVWWNTDKIAVPHTTTSGGGGKGGGGGEVTTTTYTYKMDILIGLCDNQIAGISRIWKDGKLVWSNSTSSSQGSLDASASTDLWTRLTVYTGDVLQAADPTYQAALITAGEITDPADAPAYRGRAYVFIQDLNLGSSGQIPNLIFEVQSEYNTAEQTLNLTHMPSAQVWAGAGPAWDDVHEVFLANDGNTVSAVSADGQTWTQYVGATCTGAASIFCKDGICIRGPNGGVARSTDGGQTWATVTIGGLGGGNTGKRIAVAANGDFVMLVQGAGLTQCWTSPTGATGSWTQQAAPPTGTDQGTIWNVVQKTAAGFMAPRLVAVCGGGGIAGTGAWTSDDYGAHWTRQDLPVSTIPMSLIWNGRYYFIFTQNSIIFRSATGLAGSWEQLSQPESRIDYVESLKSGAIYINALATSRVWLSVDDGQSWTLINAPSGAAWRQMVTNGFRIIQISTSDDDVWYTDGSGVFDQNTVSVQEAVRRLCLRAGLTAAQIDVTALSSITRTVSAKAISQIAPTLNTIDEFAAAYFFDYYCTDKVVFVPRGGTSVVTIPVNDLGAKAGGDFDSFKEPLEWQENNEVELPAKIAVGFIDIDNDYQPGLEESDRLVSALSDTTETVSLALGLTASEAKMVADVMLRDRSASRFSAQICVLADYSGLTPLDIITPTDLNGNQHRARIVETGDEYPFLELRIVRELSAAVYTSPGITTASPGNSADVNPAVNTILAVLDMPILRDIDDDPGPYLSARGDDIPYPGSSVFNSRDDANFTLLTSITESGTIGTASTILGDWNGPSVFDEGNSVTVDVGVNATLTGSTYAAIIADNTINAAIIGSEVIQFRDVTLISPGVYKLTGLLRGLRGTEWAMTGHAASEQFVLLQMSGMRRYAMTTAEIGDTRYWRGVTFGRLLSTAASQMKVNTGIALKPFSVTSLNALYNPTTGAIDLTWERRSRYVTRGLSTTGQSIPLGEESEAYVIAVSHEGSPTAEVNAYSSSTNSFSYTAANRTSDGFSAGEVVFTVYQISAIVGRGYGTLISEPEPSFFGGGGGAPQHDWPNPRGYVFPIQLRTHLQLGTNINLMPLPPGARSNTLMQPLAGKPGQRQDFQSQVNHNLY